jgi:alanine dehydrogenase
VLAIADLKLRPALARDAGLQAGLQVYAGRVTHAGLAQDVQRPWTSYQQIADMLAEV